MNSYETSVQLRMNMLMVHLIKLIIEDILKLCFHIRCFEAFVFIVSKVYYQRIE